MIRAAQIHATVVSLRDRGLLILGPSGSGKSGLALQMMALDAQLVSDDRTDLRRDGDAIIASSPPALRGRIEARGVGILHAQPVAEVRLWLVADLGQREDQRLPPVRCINVHGVTLPLVLGPVHPHLYAALRQMLIAGRAD